MGSGMRKTDLVVLPMIAVAAASFWLRDHVGMWAGIGFVSLLGIAGIAWCVRESRRALSKPL